MQQQPNNQPQIKDEFIVKVKLLTNQVYEFAIDPQTTTGLNLKQMISEKLNIPVDRQRIVYLGKQVLNQNKVVDHVKESGNTVHLIVRVVNNEQEQTAQTTQASTQQPQNQQQQQNQQQTFNPFGSLFRGLGVGQPQVSTMTFTNMNDLNQGLSGILGSLGINIPVSGGSTQSQPRPTTQPQNNPFQTPPTNSNRQNQQNNQPTSSFTTNVTQQTTQQTQNPQQTPTTQPQTQPQTIIPQPWSVSNDPILRLNQTITSLNLPPEPVLENRNMSLREQTSQYLRRLQHQYMRMIPQLNRSIQLLNEGRVTHLQEVLKLFEAIDGANQHAQQAIRRLIHLPVNNQPQQQQPQQPQVAVQSVQIEVQNNDEENQEEDIVPNVQATIIVQTDGSNEQSNQQTNTSSSQQFNLGSGPLSGLLSALTGQPPASQGTSSTSSQQPPLGGLNIGGLMNMFGGMMNPQAANRNQQQPAQQIHVHGPGCSHQQPQQQPQPQRPPQQQPQQLPQIDLSNLANMASMLLNPQRQDSSSSTSQQQPQQQQNPMGGLMGIFNSLQQSGGMGELMSMSLGQTLQQGGAQATIYSSIFKSFTGGDILTCFTSKNFDFLDRKYTTVRQNFLHAISIAGSQQDLVQKITDDISHLLIPKNNVNDYEGSIERVRKVIKKHVEEIVRLTMNKGDLKYSEKITQELKLAFCEGIDRVVAEVNTSTLAAGQSATGLVFQNLKLNSIRIMDQFIQGLSSMFYSFIQRDLIRVYNQHRQQIKRKQQRSLQQAASQEELIKQIQTQSKKDVEYLKDFKHSQYYKSNNEKSE